MRFVWAVAAFVLATVLIVAGIAQRTVFQGPPTQTASIEVEEPAPYVVIDGAVFNSLPGAQTLRAHADGDILAAYGRTADMDAWMADATYNQVSLTDDGTIETTLVEPEPAVIDEESEDAAAEEDAAEDSELAPGRNPAGSDLWLDEFQQSDLLIASMQVPADMSVLVAMDGTTPAPTDISVSWPIDNSTPLAGPLIALGGVLMAVGVFLYILGIQHVRRSRGPRRKGLPLPVTEPIAVGALGDEGKGVISSTPTRKSITRGRRAFAVLPVVAVSALLFTGCAPDVWPQFTAEPTPTPTATIVAPEGQQAPAVTKAQAERILTKVAATISEADEALDDDLAATRMSGPALATRDTNYTLRDALDDVASPDPILSKPLEIVLPQAYDLWPRSFMAVVDDEASKIATIMVLTQDDPWADYRLSTVGRLEASTSLPALAPAYIGAPQVQPDSPFLILPPESLATAYADVINNGEDSEYYGLFDEETDVLRAQIDEERAARLKEFNETATNTGELTFSTRAGDDPPFALATLESGAIVAVTIVESDNVKPTDDDAVIKLEKNPQVEELAGVDESQTGFTTDYLDQVFFYVPGQGSTEKIRLLGFSSDILGAKVIK
ncbi:glycosyl transferase [Microbacterium sp. C7(2022)]|uniref:glycosyl transferase n=1 Tax=Microbacterium sp. C7(2022) TaxID=2992759 RepID=UPI00237AB390|nr:glycosyl transferase [Microbacterium sp. C7(2022)]MDE0546925.1 glycosyl transferase [Microbacterium sp. C7(2022)]